MPVIRVIAKREGFHDGSRRRAGTEFEMDVAVDGDVYVLPSWVDVASDLSRRLFRKRQAVEADRAVRAAIVSSGPKAHKQVSFVEAMRAGRGAYMHGGDKAAAAALASSGSEGHKAKKAAYEKARDGRGGSGPR